MQSYRMLLSPSDFGPEEYVPHYWLGFDNSIRNLGQGSTSSGGIGGSSGQYHTTLMTTFYYTPSTGSIKITNNDATVVEYANIGSTSLLFTGSTGNFQAIGPTDGATSQISINDIIRGDTDYSVETDGTAAGDIITHYPDNTAGGTMFIVRVTSTAGKISLSGGEGSCSVDSDQDIVLTSSVDRLDYNWRLVEKYSDANFTHAAFAYYRAETVASAAPITITTDSVAQIAVEVHTFTTSDHASGNDWEMRDCVPPPVYEELDTGWIKVNQGFTPVGSLNCWLDDQEAGMDELDGVGAIYDPQGSGSRDFTGVAWSQEFNNILPEDAVIFDIEIRVTMKRINSVSFTRNRIGAAVANTFSGSYNTVPHPSNTSYSSIETSGLFDISRSDITPSAPLGVYFDFRMPSAAMGGVDIDYAEMKVHYRARV